MIRLNVNEEDNLNTLSHRATMLIKMDHQDDPSHPDVAMMGPDLGLSFSDKIFNDHKAELDLLRRGDKL